LHLFGSRTAAPVRFFTLVKSALARVPVNYAAWRGGFADAPGKVPDHARRSSSSGVATMAPTTPEYVARGLLPAHPDLPNGAGIPALVANERYVEPLARVIYYWGYPAVDALGRTSAWDVMKNGPGATMGLFPGAPKNTMG